MKTWTSRLLNAALVLFVGFLIIRRLPEFYYHMQTEHTVAPEFKVRLLSGETFDLVNFHKPLVIVFWATWCAPCQLELSRINHMIDSNDISGESVLAISSFEDPELVKQTAAQRGYKFRVGLDKDGSVAKIFQVAGTPTLLLLKENREVSWFTTGISPSLELRINGLVRP